MMGLISVVVGGGVVGIEGSRRSREASRVIGAAVMGVAL